MFIVKNSQKTLNVRALNHRDPLNKKNSYILFILRLPKFVRWPQTNTILNWRIFFTTDFDMLFTFLYLTPGNYHKGAVKQTVQFFLLKKWSNLRKIGSLLESVQYPIFCLKFLKPHMQDDVIQRQGTDIRE